MDHTELRSQSDVYYSVEADSIVVSPTEGLVTANLALASPSDGTVAQTLDLTLSFYQNGILRVLLEEPEVKRFRIAKDDLAPVVDEQLIPYDLTGKTTLDTESSLFTIDDLSDNSESWSYTIGLDRFRIEQLTESEERGKVRSLVVNPQDTLYYETEATVASAATLNDKPHMYKAENGADIQQLKRQIDLDEGRDVYRKIPESEAASLYGGVNRAIGMGFFMPSETLFGLGEREDTLVLKRTTGEVPYEMWAFDHRHAPDRINATYGSLPHVQGVDGQSSEAVTWMNAAHTYVFIDDLEMEETAGSHINFVSETGALELFLFSSTSVGRNGAMNRNQKLAQDLATITGYVSLPPVQILGYHFSKYDYVSAERIIERNKNFTEFKFPVDVLVMDIQWADQYTEEQMQEYFIFNPQNFTEEGLSQMNSAVKKAGRFMTTILDPHIKVSDDYFVYADG